MPETMKLNAEPDRQMLLIQKIQHTTTVGYSCRVEVHRHMAYCGIWSYQKTLADDEHEYPVDECLAMVKLQNFAIRGQKHLIEV